MKRTKAKRIEAWAAVFDDTGSQCEQDSVFFEKESAAYVAKLYDARPTRVAHLVEADHRADAVVKAAKAWANPKDWRMARDRLLAAVEALDAKKPKK